MENRIERILDRVPLWLRWPRWWTRQRIDRVKWFIQRGKRGYSDYDLFSFDFYLIPMLIAVLPKYTNMGEFGQRISFHDPEYVYDEGEDMTQPHAEAMLSWDIKVFRAVSYLERFWESDDLDKQFDPSQIEFVIRNIRCFWW